jgi:hypothetical protein
VSVVNPVFKIVWKMKKLRKKNFIWRAMHGILPLKSILVNRHIRTSSECPVAKALKILDIYYIPMYYVLGYVGTLGLVDIINKAIPGG